jgi:ABC-type amino acid transport substrate-binding protein
MKTDTVRRAGPVLGALLLASAPGAPADLEEVRSRGTLRVLVVAFETADEFFSTASPRPGFDREIVEGFCRLQNLKLQVVPLQDWGRLIPALQDGKGDMIAGRFTATEVRSKLIDFTSEVFPTRNAVLTRKPHRVIDSVKDLRTERVGTISGSSMAEAIVAAGVPRANIDNSIPAGGIPDALRAGKITAAVLGIESIIAARRDDPDIQLGVFLGTPGSLAYGVRKDEPELLKALNGYIENVRKTSTWSRLVVKYFGEQAPEILRKARGE